MGTNSKIQCIHGYNWGIEGKYFPTNKNHFSRTTLDRACTAPDLLCKIKISKVVCPILFEKTLPKGLKIAISGKETISGVVILL